LPDKTREHVHAVSGSDPKKGVEEHMENQRFDTFTKWFARGRLSRRTVVSVSAAAVVLTVRGAPPAGAQTPVASPVAHAGAMEFLAVQRFGAATLAPDSREAGAYTLTLSQGSDQTLYFSDRPERVVGIESIQHFLLTFGFNLSDPPNAALVVQPPDSPRSQRQAIYVVELRSGRYDSAKRQLTYEVDMLDDPSAVRLTLSEMPRAAPKQALTFGPGALFIDSGSAAQSIGCDDHDIACYTGTGGSSCQEVGSLGQKGFCLPGCTPCDGWSHFDDECNATFAACNGACTAQRNDYCAPCKPQDESGENNADCCSGNCMCSEISDSCTCA